MVYGKLMGHDVLIDVSSIKVGDRLTFRKEHERNGMKHGDTLIVTKVQLEDQACPIYVYSPDYTGNESYMSHPNKGYGYYTYVYEYLSDSLCNDCAFACRRPEIEQCDFYERR